METSDEKRHDGAVMTGSSGADGPKGFWIEVEARPGREDETLEMLRDILAQVEGEPATGPWYAVRLGPTSFAIFETFPDIAGRNTHITGGGGAILRDLERMNHLLVRPAHVHKVDVLLKKQTFTIPS